MMSTLESSTNPAIATAKPVNALSSEITTGISAPPIGSTIVTPKINAAAQVSTNAPTLVESTNSHTTLPTNAAANTALITCLAGIRTGDPVTIP